MTASGSAAPGQASGASGMSALPPMVDVHAHALLPSWVAAEARAQGVEPGQVSISGLAVPDWSVEGHLQTMDNHGIATSILSWPRSTNMLRGSAARELARAMNEEFASIIAKHPTRFGAFAVLPFDDMNAAIEEMIYAIDVLKLDGVTATTQIGGVYLGEPRYDDWLAEMNRRDVLLFVHPTPPKAASEVSIGLNVSILEYMFDVTRMIVNMVLSGAKSRFPDVKVIATHGGGTIPYLASRVGLLEPMFGAGQQRPTQSAEEILDTLATFNYDLTAATSHAQLDGLRRLVPPSRLLMGYDFPMMPSEMIAPAIAEFDQYADFTPEERRMILNENALKLLPRLAAEGSGNTRPAVGTAGVVAGS